MAPDPYTPIGAVQPDPLTAFTAQLPDNLTGQRTYLEVKQGWASYALVKASFVDYNHLLWGGLLRPAPLDSLGTALQPASPDNLLVAA